MKIVAIGGARSRVSFRKMIRHALAMTGKKKPNVLSIPTAIRDEKEYVKRFLEVYPKALNCKTDALLISKNKLSNKEMQKKLDWADAVHVCGGNTLYLMHRWRNTGLDKLIIKALKQGKVFYGESAGAICWFKSGHSDSMSYYNNINWKYIFVKGLNILPYHVAPHFYQEKKRIFSIKKEVVKRRISVVGIDADAALVLNKNLVYPIKGSKEGAVYVVEKKGKKANIRKLSSKKQLISEILK